MSQQDDELRGEPMTGEIEGSSWSVLDHRHAEPPQVQLEIEQVAPVSTASKMFAVIGFGIVMVAMLLAIVLPAWFIWWIVKRI